MTNDAKYKYTAFLRIGSRVEAKIIYADCAWVENGVVYFGAQNCSSWFRMLGTNGLIDLVRENVQNKIVEEMSDMDFISSLIDGDEDDQSSTENEHPVLKDEHPTVLPKENK